MKPGTFILDLLRTYERRGTSARNIMATGKMFTFSENLIRVTLSRLVTKGAIENYERGQYRLAPLADPVNDLVEEWRLGEARRRPWQTDHYLVVHLENANDREVWVLTILGFRLIRTFLWCRPDNLIRNHEDLVAKLHELGVGSRVFVGSGVKLSPDDVRLVANQYDVPALTEQYMEMTAKLIESERAFNQITREQAMVNSFRLGGEAIQLLAKDPLLPEEIQPSAQRVKLWETMLRYDQVGREIWSNDETKPSIMPTSVASYA